MEFSHPEYLVATDWLAHHLDDPHVVVLDVTAKLTSGLENGGGRALWAASHIPGSQFFDVAAGKGELSDPDAGLPWTWPSHDRVEATMTAHGVGAGTRVVLVARTPRAGIDSGTMWCTRAWWTLHHMGVDCAVLHGGIEAWAAEGRPLTDEPTPQPAPPATPFRVAPGWETARAVRDDVLAAVEAGDGPTCIVDALSAETYRGEEPGYGRPGHIVGAVNVPFRGLIDRETSGFVDAERMHRTLVDAGVLDAPAVITYCGGAIAATVDAFCLSLLGHERVAVYDGSLMEWAADPELPMEEGADR